MNECKAVTSLKDISSRKTSNDASIKGNIPSHEAVDYSLMHPKTLTCPNIAYAMKYASRVIN